MAKTTAVTSKRRGKRIAKKPAPAKELASHDSATIEHEDGKTTVVLMQPEMQRREAFAQAFVQTGNKTKAAGMAGFTGTPASLARRGAYLMQEPAVRKRVQQIQQNLLLKFELTTEDVIAELARGAFCDPGEAFDANGDPLPIPEIPENVRRAVAGYKVVRKTFGEDGESVEKELKFMNKESCLDKLGKHLGLWKDDNDSGGRFSADQFLSLMLAARRREGEMRVHGNQQKRTGTALEILDS